MKINKLTTGAFSALSIMALNVLQPAFVVSANTESSVNHLKEKDFALTESVTFTNHDLYESAKKLYENNEISKEDFQAIQALAFERWGFKGENKIVKNPDGSIDLYINNVVSGVVVGGSVAAIAAAIVAIPPVAAFLATYGVGSGVAAAAIGGGVSAFTSADNGLIITMRVIGTATSPNLVITNVREQ